MPGVRPLEPHGHVRERHDAVQVDEHRDQSLLALSVPEGARGAARLPVLARRIAARVVPADGVCEELGRLTVAVDDLVGPERMRVDERVDVHLHVSVRLPVRCPADYLLTVREATPWAPPGSAGTRRPTRSR